MIGRRRLDGHFYGLCKLGAVMSGEETYRFDAPAGLSGRELFLDEASVTATEQILIAAAAARGTTTLYNAACEPHVRDLAELLNAMGARISGAGSNTIEIEGVERLHGCRYRVVGDHIEAGSFLALAAATGGEITVEGTQVRHYWMLRRVFERLGVRMELRGIIFFCPAGRNAPSNATSAAISRRSPTAVAAVSVGYDELHDRRRDPVPRHGHVLRKDVRKPHLLRRQADQHGGKRDCLRPAPGGRHRPAQLHAVTMSSPDIRAGMAMVIAALCARGTSTIHSAEVIYRGYENLIEKLTGIGGKISEIRN